MKMNLTSIVSGTTTNTDALPFFYEMEKSFSNGEKLIVSLDNSSTMSSSFLNSSIGEFIDKYGLDGLQKTLSFVNYTSSQIDYIKKYVDYYKEFQH